jgi:DNA-directed RNA polymerase subunit N (RpoN/RPB10)
MRKIIRNAIRCNHCGDVIESTYRHDYVQCSCGRVAVDGGNDYLRRSCASSDDYTDLSESIQIPDDEVE